MLRFLTIALMLNCGASTAIAEERFGDWSYVRTKDKVTNKISVHIYTNAKKGKTKFGDTPFMGIDCDDMYFGNIAVIDDGDILMRVNTSRSALSLDGDEWQRNDGTTIDLRNIAPKRYTSTKEMFRYYKTHFASFVSGKETYVKFSMYSEQDLNVTFSLRGFTKAIDALQYHCSNVEDVILKRARHLSKCNKKLIDFTTKNKNKEYKKPKECTDEYLDQQFGYDSLR